MRPLEWLYLEIESPSAEHHAVLAEGLIACGATAVEERGALLATWLRPAASVERTDYGAWIADIRCILEQAAGAALRLHWEVRPDEDWEARWREGLGARRVGRRLVVTRSWITPDARVGDVVIVIDPEMGFGTGEHASTRGALKLLEAAVTIGCRVLDVGTGSGILGIAAARLGAQHVDAVDSDADALVNAVGNVTRNGCVADVSVCKAVVDLDYLFGTAVAAGAYDVIVANVPSGVLIPLMPGFRAALRPGGALVLAGIREPAADTLIEEAAQHGLVLTAEDRDDGWWAGSFRRTDQDPRGEGPP